MYFLFFNQHELLRDETVWQPIERGLSLVRSRFPQLTVGALETLLHIARCQPQIASGDISLADLARDLGTPYPTLARHTDVLGRGVGGKGGLGLVEKAGGGRGRRQRVELTQAGMEFLTELYLTFHPPGSAHTSRIKRISRRTDER